VRVLVISTPVFQICPPEGTTGYAGLECIAYHVAKGLSERGHTVSLLAPDGSSCPGVEIIPCGPAGRVDESSGYSGWWEQLSEDQSLPEDKRRKYHDGYWKQLPNFDVIIDHSWLKSSYLLKMEGKLRAPILAVMHAPCQTMYGSLPPVEKFCAVCISKDQATHFEALFNRPARVAYNGINPEVYRPLGIPRSKRYLFLARFSTVKSPQLSIEACLKANVGLDLIGDTSITQEPELLEYCRRMADGENIRIIGGIPRGECVWWYSRAHALTHLNRDFREPFGLAPVEAQACGCPVIGWRRGSLSEIVNEGVTGYLVSSVDEAIEIIRSGKIDSIDRKVCRDWASTFSVERMVNRYEELCIEAADTGGW
jgi:glycosyltransferase involved in cell wall biosynthesis